MGKVGILDRRSFARSQGERPNFKKNDFRLGKVDEEIPIQLIPARWRRRGGAGRPVVDHHVPLRQLLLVNPSQHAELVPKAKSEIPRSQSGLGQVRWYFRTECLLSDSNKGGGMTNPNHGALALRLGGWLSLARLGRHEPTFVGAAAPCHSSQWPVLPRYILSARTATILSHAVL
ncbi:hypothetical protein OOU_Y34scaffold00548g37 [Pyricularia oryzae Y34]|uniref:Uncharacterized protein n=1 Tax=Pyricularia oryzae (strain Y34) TaxID=1143189 RepID=A0AA97PKN5_PYRO3|nr:hypothetical protein OOU_Y34scaffold00548g37 [Pyricularia oryzae Y34]